MARGITFTFEEGCNKYLENCRQRNLREGTINHYRQSYRPRIILELPSQNKKQTHHFGVKSIVMCLFWAKDYSKIEK